MQQEGRQIELPKELTEDEAMRLDILISKMSQPPPMPRYTLDLMPPSLSKDGALNLALQYSVPPPPLPLPSWAPGAAPSPAPPPAAPAYASLHPNWPWVIPNMVDLIQLPSDVDD
jgi:hypothetical protein